MFDIVWYSIGTTSTKSKRSHLDSPLPVIINSKRHMIDHVILKFVSHAFISLKSLYWTKLNWTEHIIDCVYYRVPNIHLCCLKIIFYVLREAAKKVIFSVARPLRPYPSPSSLVAIGTFFLVKNKLQKIYFFLVARPFPSSS